MAVSTGTIDGCLVHRVDGAGVVGHHRQITGCFQSPALDTRCGPTHDLVECEGVGRTEQKAVDLAGQVGRQALGGVGQNLHAAARGDDHVVHQGIGAVIDLISSPQKSRRPSPSGAQRALGQRRGAVACGNLQQTAHKMVHRAAGGHDDAGIGPGIAGVLREDAVQFRRAQPHHTGRADFEVSTHTQVTVHMDTAVAHQGRHHERISRLVVGIQQIVHLALEHTGHARGANAVVGHPRTLGVLVIQLVSGLQGGLPRSLHRRVARGFELHTHITGVISEPSLDGARQPVGGDHAFVGQSTPAVLKNAAFSCVQLARRQGAQL